MAQGETKKAVIAGGCFWCVESDFEKLDGITEAVSGYAGGDRPSPVYENYYETNENFTTPHIEVVELTYDPAIISYRDIIEYQMRHIDPTDGDGQFCDRGEQYRPAIFVKNEEERTIAETVIKETAQTLGQDINVDILPDAPFYPAEAYHQDYASKNPVRYKFYRWNCGRDQRINDVWDK
tara:strand:+ start:156 stop:695 length:540 start_codon:yes stop_codon:yes gene_type:complete